MKNNSKLRILAVLVNYGDEQIFYLNRVVKELKNFKKYNVTIQVNSNIPIESEYIDKVEIFQLNDFQLLPLTCRKVIWENRKNYDIFLFGENDHLFIEKHIDNHIIYSEILPKNRISGLMQFEEKNDMKFFPAYHLDYKWDFSSVEIYDNKKFAHFNNLHQATFILTQKQLFDIGKKINFLKLVNENSFLQRLKNRIRKLLGLPLFVQDKYSVKCKVNTDIFQFGGMKKLICISEFQENLIHHLPNLYIDGEKGRIKFNYDDKKMKKVLEKML